MHRRGRPALLVVLVALVLAAAASGGVRAGEDAPTVRPVTLPWVEGPRKGYEVHYVDLTSQPPQGVTALEAASDALYGRLAMGASSLLVATRVKDGPYRVLIDADFDGDLADEVPVSFAENGKLWETQTTLAPPAATFPADLELAPVFYRWRTGTPTRLYLFIPGHRAGAVVLEGRLRKIAVYDDDADLLFGAGETDAVLLDVDGDGVLDRAPGARDRIRPGRPFRVRDAAWRLDLDDPTAASATLVRVEDAPPVSPGRWAIRGVPRPYTSRRPNEERLRQIEAQTRAVLANRDDGALAFQLRRVLDDVGRMGTDDAFQLLYRVYRFKGDARLRATAVTQMGNTAFVGHASKLAGIARSARDPLIQSAAVAALHRMNAPDRERAYLAVLRHPADDSVYEAAALHLAYTRSEKAREALATLLRKRLTPAHEYAVYTAATRYTDEPPTPEMVERAARSKSAATRALGLAHARHLDPRLAHRLALDLAEDAAVTRSLAEVVADVLGRWGDAASVEAVVPLAGTLSDAARGKLVNHLRLVRDGDAVEVLLDELSAPAPATRALAAEVLRAVPAEGVGEVLAARLARERDPAVIRALTKALEKHPSDAAVGALVHVARKHASDGEVQETVLKALASIGFQDSAVADYFSRCLEARAWADRALAVETAAGTGSRFAAPYLLSALDDDAWQVRFAAAKGLGTIRLKAAVLPLIRRLEVEEEPRVRIAVEEALFRTTGQHLYDVAARWRLWWKDHGVAFEVPETVPERPPSNDDARYATFYGLPVRATKVVFVIDKSGSMGPSRRLHPHPGAGAEPVPSKLQIAVQETLEVARCMGPAGRAGVILFDSRVRRWRSGLVRLTAAARQDLKEFLEKQPPSGGTNLYDAVEMALETPNVEEIYLLSDGMPGSGKFVLAENIVREVGKLNHRKRILIHSVSLGHDSPLLESLAHESGGTYVRR